MGRFTLDGKTYTLATNNGPNHLHGGLKGFDKVVWTPELGKAGAAVTLAYLSKDGEEGYPGTLQARVSYRLNDQDELSMEYRATTDKPTVLNLTNHSYFNLTAHGEADITCHVLELQADRYLPVDSTLIPTGVLAPVEGTPFDFRKPTAIGARIDDPHEQIKNGNGYDHTFVVNRKGPGLVKLARVVEPTSGRVLEVETSEPGVQFYTGNFLDGRYTGKQGRGAEWPGMFEIVQHERPRTWKCARSVVDPDSKRPVIRVDLRGERPIGEKVHLFFRYELRGGETIDVRLLNAKTKDQWTANPIAARNNTWSEARVTLSRGAGERGNAVRDFLKRRRTRRRTPCNQDG